MKISTLAPYQPRFATPGCATCPPKRERMVSRVRRVRGGVGAMGASTSAPSTWTDYAIPALLAVGGGVAGFFAAGPVGAVGGVALGGGVGYVVQQSMAGSAGGGGGSSTGSGGAHLGGTIRPHDDAHVPAPPGNSPLAGYASPGLFQWDYVVGSGDSAGSIALAIVGDDARYQELITANHDLGTVGIPGMVGKDEWNFQPGALVAGKTVLAIPMTWDAWIDQKRTPRGARTPWPDDLRPPMSGHVGGSHENDVEEYDGDGDGADGSGGDGSGDDSAEVIHYTAEEMVEQVRERARGAREGAGA